MTYKDFDYKSIKQLIAKIRKCKTCHGFVQTSDHDGMYVKMQKKDLIAMINEAPESVSYTHLRAHRDRG